MRKFGLLTFFAQNKFLVEITETELCPLERFPISLNFRRSYILSYFNNLQGSSYKKQSILTRYQGSITLANHNCTKNLKIIETL